MSHANFRDTKQAKTTVLDPWPQDKQSSIREEISEGDFFQQELRISDGNEELFWMIWILLIKLGIWNWQNTMENLEEVSGWNLISVKTLTPI